MSDPVLPIPKSPTDELGGEHPAAEQRAADRGDDLAGDGDEADADAHPPAEGQLTERSPDQCRARSSRLRIFPAPEMGRASTTSVVRGSL